MVLSRRYERQFLFRLRIRYMLHQLIVIHEKKMSLNISEIWYIRFTTHCNVDISPVHDDVMT